MRKIRTNIELFAGCGGMALGMESAGFSLKFANEVSPMASNTFAFNILGVDISSQSNQVKWIHSRYAANEYEKRLRENLLSHKIVENSEIDKNTKIESLQNCLLVGDIRHLNEKFVEIGVSDPFNGSLDLISGGPPCQSFSLAGKRERTNYKNSLPLEFAEICKILNPKVVLLENVKGILSAFTENGTKHFAWFEVAKAFAINGFAPICMLINSKYFGVAQNRPRYIMLAIRLDVFQKLYSRNIESKILTNVDEFVSKIKLNKKVEISDLNYYDIEKCPESFDGKILPKPFSYNRIEWTSVFEAIDDLVLDGNKQKSEYVKKINSLFPSSNEKHNEIQNHNIRTHSIKIKERFLFFQILNYLGDHKTEILNLQQQGDLHPTINILKIYNHLNSLNVGIKKIFKTPSSFEKFISSIDLSKKHSQRALVKDNPSPAQLTIPDDICHYSLMENRVLSVREIARIQSFPDSFVFRSKETTGGINRSYEVPQYTQVGNAVPPLMAYHLGKHVINMLNEIEM